MYRPRDANIIADYLAGEASKAAYDLPYSQTQPSKLIFQPHTMLQYELELSC